MLVVDQIISGDINLEPEYQRGKCIVVPDAAFFTIDPDVVWPEAKQIGLIDSIFRNYYVPPIIFCEFVPVLSAICSKLSAAVNSSEDGSETRTCIDGKQRLTSIQRCVSQSLE